ncbi:WXG100 family type VII secretion target [Micromonospora globispora]|uniref:WXG100 family type VII secretion target n=1 Tax=Micromonospora globispora TaxID=1450148 RepID=UPI001FAED617|nr:WXG100 family type VII secretion target [Micromonospora globispora]
MTNPLVATPTDAPVNPWAGVWIAEDIQLIGEGVTNGSWIDGSLGVVGAALDGLALVSDPVGSLLQYGVAWIIEHVRPLTEALDWLAGDPAQIAAHAQTWRNVAGSLRDEAESLARAVRLDVAEWGGSAGPAYRNWAAEQQQAVVGLSHAADTMALVTEGAGMLIAAVRLMVRDAIATCVSRLIVYAAEEAATLGFATPLVVEQVTTTVAAWAAKIAQWLRGLLASLRRLIPEMHRLGGLIEKLKQLLNKLDVKAGGSKSHNSPSEPNGSSKHQGRDPDFDPGSQRAPLGDEFSPGVVDPKGLFEDKERAIADRLAEEGEMVHPRERIDSVENLKNPDSMIRRRPDDPGTVTEFKTLEGDSSTSVRRNILTAGRQVAQEGGGELVMDGRAVGLNEEDARRGYARAVGQHRQHGSPLPDRVRVILGDNRIITLPD